MISNVTTDTSASANWAGSWLPEVHRFSVEQYDRLIEAGVLTADDHVELVEGVVRMMSPIGSAHEVSTNLTAAAIRRLLPNGWHERIQQTVRLPVSKLQPDIAVVRGSIRDYAGSAPTPDAVGLVVEVADSSVGYDLGAKALLYSQGGIKEYWVVNLVDRRVEVFRGPGPEYATRLTFAADARVPFTLDCQTLGEIPVAEILP